MKLDLQWNSQQGILTSPYGIAPGYVKSDVVYMNAVDAYSLFHLRGELTPDYVYNMYSVKAIIHRPSSSRREAGMIDV